MIKDIVFEEVYMARFNEQMEQVSLHAFNQGKAHGYQEILDVVNFIITNNQPMTMENIISIFKTKSHIKDNSQDNQASNH